VDAGGKKKRMLKHSRQTGEVKNQCRSLSILSLTDLGMEAHRIVVRGMSIDTKAHQLRLSRDISHSAGREDYNLWGRGYYNLFLIIPNLISERNGFTNKT
jgi:hypothetical protein